MWPPGGFRKHRAVAIRADFWHWGPILPRSAMLLIRADNVCCVSHSFRARACGIAPTGRCPPPCAAGDGGHFQIGPRFLNSKLRVNDLACPELSQVAAGSLHCPKRTPLSRFSSSVFVLRLAAKASIDVLTNPVSACVLMCVYHALMCVYHTNRRHPKGSHMWETGTCDFVI